MTVKLLTPMDEVLRLATQGLNQLHTTEMEGIIEFDEDAFNAVYIQLYKEVNREK